MDASVYRRAQVPAEATTARATQRLAKFLKSAMHFGVPLAGTRTPSHQRSPATYTHKPNRVRQMEVLRSRTLSIARGFHLLAVRAFRDTFSKELVVLDHSRARLVEDGHHRVNVRVKLVRPDHVSKRLHENTDRVLHSLPDRLKQTGNASRHSKGLYAQAPCPAYLVFALLHSVHNTFTTIDFSEQEDDARLARDLVDNTPEIDLGVERGFLAEVPMFETGN
jgi:hypothetical protein